MPGKHRSIGLFSQSLELSRAKADSAAFIAKMTTALAILRRWVERLEAAEKSGHWRTQPPVPPGVPKGGQWTDGPYSGSDAGSDSTDFALWLRTGRKPLLAQATPRVDPDGRLRAIERQLRIFQWVQHRR